MLACRTFVSTRRVLAPTHCLSKARRGRRRPGSGDNDEQDDDYGDGGSNDGNGGFGGDSGGGDWDDGEDQHGRHLFESVWLWQALCFCSFLQVCSPPCIASPTFCVAHQESQSLA